MSVRYQDESCGLVYEFGRLNNERINIFYEKVRLEVIFMRYFYLKNETVQNDQRLIQKNSRKEHEVL